MKVILSHPTGNANVRATAKGFADAHILEKYFTSIASFPDSFLDKISKIGFSSEVKRRQYDVSLQQYTQSFPWYEAGRLLAIKAGLHRLTEHQKGFFSIDQVYQSFDHYVSQNIKRYRSKINAVYAYEDGAEFSFQMAKQYGVSCFYDLPIGYWRSARKLLATEAERWPEWKGTLTGFKDSQTKLERKDNELKLSDHIFVASSFTAKTLEDYPDFLKAVSVIPYGFPSPCLHREYVPLHNRPLKILFVGGLSQRKGIADLFAAVDAIGKDVQLTVVGKKSVEDCEALNQALRKYTWIPSLPHHKILELMREHDVLLFPSLFEGFGLVITEAMSQGTPVITTNRTAGPDIIENEKNGWIVEAGSTKALEGAIVHLLEHPDEIAKAGQAAIHTAEDRPWFVYGNELANEIRKYRD